MIDVKKLAEKAGAHHSAVTSAHCFRPRELEAFAALVLEEAAVECERIFNAPESEGGYDGQDAYYTRPVLQCAEAIRAMKPAKEQKT